MMVEIVAFRRALASQIPRPLVPTFGRSPYRAPLTGLEELHTSAISRREAPELCMKLRPIEGAGNAGRSLHPQPRVRNETKHTSIVTTVTPEITRPSPRNGFTAYFALSPVTRLV